MLNIYKPRRFCKEFVEAAGIRQLAMIMATIKGIKPCMDDWILPGKYDAYRKICKRYGIFVKHDIISRLAGDDYIPEKVIGKESLASRAFGLPFNKTNQKGGGGLHVFVSKSKKRLEDAFKNGWYPLIIKDRVISSMSIDGFKFGRNLGYPECCIGLFYKYYNRHKEGYLYAILKNTPGNKYSYLCNPFLRDTAYSYIYHLPCSYNCRATIEWVKNIKDAIRDEEPEFADRIDRNLKLPVLVFYERQYYAFEGEIKNGRLYYKHTYSLVEAYDDGLYGDDLRKGDCVFLEDRDVVILKRGRMIKRIKWKKLLSPKIPFIIQFS